MKSKINAVTTKKAIEILGCTRSTFYYSYKRKLEVLGKEKNDILYKESDVLLLKEEIELIKNKFNIIK